MDFKVMAVGIFLPKIKNRYFRAMILLRKLLFPFGLIYGFVTDIRNMLYDRGVFKSATFPVPIIAVGNLSVGGTGKSPQIEYLIRLLSPQYKLAVLSRGYKRKSQGFVLADSNATAETLGDEPFQFYSKFPNIHVAVDADRRNGIAELLALEEKPHLILLDDAYQHRKVKAGFYILLTAYNDLYCEDLVLPAGNLRENKSGADRANVIVVTKCPSGISEKEQQQIRKKLSPNVDQKVYFTCIDYDSKVFSQSETAEISEIRMLPKILLAGIAKPKPFFAYLRNEKDIILEYPDHHAFTEKDISTIKEKAKHKKIITTEKDYVRLKDNAITDLFYLPIKSKFISGSDHFDKTILDYVGTSTGNG
jgi:tetraacyldisaccharide 4'-kinase